MELPPEPPLLKKQRYVSRFWDTADMLEALSIYYGCTCAQYPYTWKYRTLIAVHREQYTDRFTRKGYGKDWKEDVKPDVVQYTEAGRLPLTALKRGAEFIRQADQTVWALVRAKRNEADAIAMRVAAE
jgi:hypothetical protein